VNATELEDLIEDLKRKLTLTSRIPLDETEGTQH
jgi:hypothetical protein